MRHILTSAAVGVLSLFLTNPVSAGHGGGGGGGHAGGGGGHPGGGGNFHGGGYYHGGYSHYGYGYPGIGIGLGYGLGYGAYPYYDSTPIYVPPVGPTVGPSSYSYYPPEAPVLGSAIAPPGVAPPPQAAAINVPPDEAYVRVLVPDANAEVLLEGKVTDVLGRERLFSSPKLDPGSKYTYTVTASWLDQGHLVRQTREVALNAGQVSVVDFRRVR